jgi:hypothetical protein
MIDSTRTQLLLPLCSLASQLWVPPLRRASTHDYQVSHFYVSLTAGDDAVFMSGTHGRARDKQLEKRSQRTGIATQQSSISHAPK